MVCNFLFLSLFRFSFLNREALIIIFLILKTIVGLQGQDITSVEVSPNPALSTDQISVTIRYGQGGCWFLSNINQNQSGNVINITLNYNSSPGPCPQFYFYYDTILLLGPFQAGIYQINVIGYGSTDLVVNDPPPTNNDCLNPRFLSTSNLCPSTIYSNIGATAENYSSSCFGSNAPQDVWFRFTVPTTGRYKIDLIGTGNSIKQPELSLNSDNCNVLSEIQCASSAPNATVANLMTNNNLTAGQYYRLRVSSRISAGNFKLCITLIAGSGCASPPTPNITGGGNKCAGSTAPLIASSGFTQYVWSNGTTTASSVVFASGTYTVTVRDAAGCTGTASTSVTVFPSIAISNVSVNGLSGTFQVTGGQSQSTGNNYSAVVMALQGNPSVMGTLTTAPFVHNETVSFTVPQMGSYIITITDAAGCSRTGEINVTNSCPPPPIITGPTALCAGAAALSASGNYTQWKWSTGAVTQNITAVVSQTYTVTATDANGCTGTDTHTVSGTSPLPTVNITGLNTLCNGMTTLDAGSHDTYKWSDGQTTRLLTVSNQGAYKVTVSNSFGCTKASALHVISGNAPNPMPQISGPTVVCPGRTTTLDVGSGYSSYKWSNGATNKSNITVSTADTYTVTVTNSQGCSNTASAVVTITANPQPIISGATMLCAGGTAILEASAGFAQYRWNVGSQTSRSIAVNTSGVYSVTTTAVGGCTGTAIVSVSPYTAPIITGIGDVCYGKSTVFDAGPGYLQYQWSNGQSTRSISASSSGIYTVTVTGAGGCTGTSSRTLNIQPEILLSIDGFTAICPGNTTVLNAGNGYNQYIWSNSQTSSTISVSTEGSYSVTVTGNGGCTQSAGVYVTVSTNPSFPIYVTDGTHGPCPTVSATLEASGKFVGYRWSAGLQTTQSIYVNASGTYTVTVTALGGCTGTSSVVLNGNSPMEACAAACIGCNTTGFISGSTASFSGGYAPGFCGTLHNDQWVGFIANSTTATFTATPAGCEMGDGIQIALYADCNIGPVDCNGGLPEGGTTPLQMVDVPLVIGQAYFMVIDGYIGDICSFSISISPTNAMQAPNIGSVPALQGPKSICSGGKAVYTIPGIVSGADRFTWNAPNGSRVNGQVPPVTIDNLSNGSTVTVTFGSENGIVSAQAANACRVGATQSLNVTVSPILPKTLGKLSVCLDQFPIILPWGEEIDIRPAGNYTFQTTLVGSTGCDSVVIQPVQVLPSYLIGPIIRYVCADNPTFNICGTSYMAPNPNIEHNCKTFLGCDSIVKINLNVLHPIATIVASGNTTLSCTNNQVILRSLASPAPTVKSWRPITPNGTLGAIMGTGDTLKVVIPGKYVLLSSMTVQSVNCTKLDTFEVLGSNQPPTALALGGTLTCATSSITLSGSSNTSGVTYNWAGPNNFSSNQQNPVVSTAGTYTLTVRAPNGCSSMATAVVAGNSAALNNTAIASGPITCLNQATGVSITTTTTATTPVYTWAGPNGFTSTSANPTVLAAGLYTVTVTNSANNCTGTATVNILSDKAPPIATISSSGTITCPTPLVTLSTTPVSGVTYQWSGPNSFSGMGASVSAPLAGTYFVTATKSSNGCSATASANVTGNTVAPINAAAVSGPITCANQATGVTITTTTTATTPVYNWAGPNGFTSASANPTVLATGIYTVTVTNSADNCTGTASATVSADKTPPTPSVSGIGAITCPTPLVTLTATPASGVTYLWSGPSGFSGNAVSVSAPLSGVYTVTVTKNTNGCSATASATVTGNTAPPTINATVSGLIGCSGAPVALSAMGNATNPVFVWSGPNGFSSALASPQVTAIGIYTVTVTDGANQCTNSATVAVAKDNAVPNATITPSGPTTFCQGGSVTLAAPVLTGYQYQWQKDGFNIGSATSSNYTANSSGSYTVVITQNNCVSTSTATNINLQAPPSASFAHTANGTTVTFGNLSNHAASFAWNFGDGTNSIEANPTHTYAMDGSFMVALTVTNVCGVSTANQTIVIVTPPTAGFSANVSKGCAPMTVQFTNNSSGNATGFSWQFPGGTPATSSAANPTVQYTAAGMYSVMLIVSNTAGNNTAIQTNLIEVLAPNATVSANGTTVFCPGQSVTLSAATGPGYTYQWKRDGNNITGAISANYVATTGGNYTVAVTQSGCTASSNPIPVSVIPAPTPAFNVNISGANVLFTNASLNAGSYLWQFGDGTLGTDANPSHTYADGTYNVILTAINGCDSISTLRQIVIATNPVASFTVNKTSGCAPLTVQYMNTSSANAVNFNWQFPGGNPASSTAKNPTVIYAAPGTYAATLTASNSTGSSTVTQNNPISVLGPPISNFTTNIDDSKASFTNVSTNATSYNWNFGDGFSSTNINPEHIYLLDGTYTVTLSATNTCGVNTSTQQVTISTKPTASFTLNTASGCAPLTVQYTNNSSANAVNFNWQFPGGNPATSTAKNPTVVYNAPGTYAATLTVSNATGNSDAITKTNLVIVNGIPKASFNSSINGATVTFDNTSANASSYTWNFGDGNSSTEINPTHTYAAVGEYVVTLTAKGSCNPTNAFSERITITLIGPPSASFSTNVTTGCAPLTVRYKNGSSNATSYSWLFQGGTPATSTEENPTVVYNTPGIYAASLYVSSPFGNDMLIQNDFIQVQGPPTPNFAVSINQMTASFTDFTTSYTTKIWDFGDGAIDTSSTNPIHTYAINGEYWVTLTAFNACGSNTYLRKVTISGKPTARFTSKTLTGCAPLTVQFNNNSSNATLFNWRFPGGNPATSSLPSPTVTYNAHGNYVVSLTATNEAGDDSSKLNLTIFKPTVSLGEDRIFCFPGNVSLDATASNCAGCSYQWSVGVSGTSAIAVSPATPTIYSVTATDANGCKATAQVKVSPQKVSQQSITVDICEGDSIMIGGGTFKRAGDYVITLKTAAGCDSLINLSLRTFSPSDFVANPDTGLLLPDERSATIDVLLNDNFLIDKTFKVIEPLPRHGTAEVDKQDRLLYSQRNSDFFGYDTVYYQLCPSNGCLEACDTGMLAILVQSGKVEDAKKIMPNVILPNGAELNKEFDPLSILVQVGLSVPEERAKLYIFTRFGEVVFSPSKYEPWKGNSQNGRLLPEGTYYYLLRWGDAPPLKGPITLLK